MARMSDFLDSAKDPVTNAIVSSTEAYLIITDSSTETGDYTVPDLAIPSSPNFPPVNPTRYFGWLPGAPDYTNIDAGNSTFKVVNTASTTVLNRVAYNASLTANTYKIFPETQDSPSAIEYHVGSTSSTAGSGISFQGRFLNFIADSGSFNDIVCDSIDPASLEINLTRYSSTDSTSVVKLEYFIKDLGVWNMSSTSGGAASLAVTHNIGENYKNIMYADANIQRDDSTSVPLSYPLMSPFVASTDVNPVAHGYITNYNSTDFTLNRTAGFFDASIFNSTSINRGVLTVTYFTT